MNLDILFNCRYDDDDNGGAKTNTYYNTSVVLVERRRGETGDDTDRLISTPTIYVLIVKETRTARRRSERTDTIAHTRAFGISHSLL